MEPARHGRDDPGKPRSRANIIVKTAMEPARQGGMTITGPVPGVVKAVPQWSPPVMGGMTSGVSCPALVSALPQWSPPVMGGMTP